jgi:hypothetical protein
MMDFGAMYVLTQLQAEVERVRHEMTLIQASYSGLRRIAGVFYDAGVDDALKGKHRRSRHLRSVDD